ncbi:MAG TPA: MBL fold metallo-hydrolase [Anaerolineales bacterium]|nr:MBL fold metallo-hydrolase [Anaerolineales bacterium]
MRIWFHGAAQTVTGSRHLLEINGHRLLLDCGLYQGRRHDTYERNLNFPFEPTSVHAVVLSHAHIDHCGNLPNLVRRGYQGPIHATHATADLADIMLRDAGHIQESDTSYLNKKLKRRGQPLVDPIYTGADAAVAARHLTSHDYDHPFEPVPGVSASLVEAGHILGSAAVVLDIQDRGRTLRLMFSGDIGRPGMPLVRDPVPPNEIDYLIMECTYGDRTHEAPDQAYASLHDLVKRTIERGGKVIIPAFAVGRTQALVYYLHQMFERNELPRVPVYVDSPLAVNVTAIFREHPECFDGETQAFMRSDPHGAALGFDMLTYTQSVNDSKAINERPGPMIIISASGMAETGRILHHLRNNIQDERNCILITSWMAPHTLGRRLAEGEKQVRIFGETFNVRAEVGTLAGLSSHADRDYLLTYVRQAGGRLKGIFLVHGERGPAEALMERMKDAGLPPVSFPALGDEVEI